MYEDLLNQLINKYGANNEELNGFIDLMVSYYLFRRDEFKKITEEKKPPKERKTPTLDDIELNLRLVESIKNNDDEKLFNYVYDEAFCYITIDFVFWQFIIDIYFIYQDNADKMLNTYFSGVWYSIYYNDLSEQETDTKKKEHFKNIHNEFYNYIIQLDEIKLTEEEIKDNINLSISKKRKLCYMVCKNVYSKCKSEMYDILNSKDNILNCKTLIEQNKNDLDKMLDLITKLRYCYLEVAQFFKAVNNILYYDFKNILNKYNEREKSEEELKTLIQDIKDFFLKDKQIEKTTQDHIKPKKAKINNTPKKATQEEIKELYEYQDQDYYKTNSTPTNRTILNTYGAWASIETNTLDKLIRKISTKEQQLAKAKTKKAKDELKAEIDLLKDEKISQENILKELQENIATNKNNLDDLIKEYKEKKEILSQTEQKQYENTISILRLDLDKHEKELNEFNNKGIVFRGNIFNHLEYTDKKGKTIATLRNKNGQPLEANDIPPLANAFLRLTNDYYYNRLDNYNEFIGKIDVLFPTDKGITYKIANNTIKNNLGKTGYIINVKDLLKTLNVAEDSYKYFGKTLKETIRFFNDIEINLNQEDIFTNKKDILNVFFGITSNVYISRQLDNNIYLYYEISTPYEAILDSEGKPLIAQTPKALLKYAVGQKGNKRVFTLGDYLYTILRESLNNGKGGVRIDKNGNYYKLFNAGTLINKLKEQGLLNKEARPRKYRDDIFNPFIKALNTLSEDDEGNGEHLIDYTLFYDDSVSMSNATFKGTFELSKIKITYLKVSDEYENILSKNIKNKSKANITNANNFILTWGKYKGKTLKEILKQDKTYLEWVLNSNEKIPKPKITKQHIKNLLEYEKEKEQLKNK